jgi:hypothetical protein
MKNLLLRKSIHLPCNDEFLPKKLIDDLVFLRPNDDELLRICGGRTAHKYEFPNAKKKEDLIFVCLEVLVMG